MNKKLVLAPAVALAITGLGAAPVFATDADWTDSIQAPATDNVADVYGLKNVSAPKSDDSAEAKGATQQAIAASLTVTPTELTQSELVDPGVTITVTGLQPGDVVTDSLTGKSVTAEGDTVEFAIVNATGDPTAIEPGDIAFTVTIERAGETSQSLDAGFTVLADTAEPPADEPGTIDAADEITVSEINGEGLPFTGAGFAPGEEVSLAGGGWENDEATTETLFTTTVTADENGEISGNLTALEEITAGSYGFSAASATEETDVVPFTVTKDSTEEPSEDPTADPSTPAAAASLTITPENIETADFVNEDKGVTLAVENCTPGDDVRFRVNPKGTDVSAFDKTVQADDAGKAEVSVYGDTASNAAAYVGAYDVTVICGDDKLTGAFTVTDGATAGGNDGNDDGDNAGTGDLPRTGIELTGLGLGATLLVIGGATVVFTRRRATAQAPSEI